MSSSSPTAGISFRAAMGVSWRYRQGILLGPVVGQIAAELAMGVESGRAIDALRPDRFHGRSSKA